MTKTPTLEEHERQMLAIQMRATFSSRKMEYSREERREMQRRWL